MDIKDKFVGVTLGTAIGDALGYGVEFKSLDEIQRIWGVAGLRELTANAKDSQGRPCALYSDDTQMFRAVCEGLLRAGPQASVDAAAEEIAEEFIAWSVSPENNRAPGTACMLGCRNLKAGIPWSLCGKEDGKGCGAAMRSMAYGLWSWKDPDQAAIWAGAHAFMTHRSKVGQASAAAVAAGVAAGIVKGTWEDVAAWMTKAAAEFDQGTADMLVEAQRDAATYKGEASIRVLDRWRGWRGDEAVAASLYCGLVARDYREAVILAINSPGDSDSLGAITGALAGAIHGAYRSPDPVAGEEGERRLGIPPTWIACIERQDELVALASRAWKAWQ